MCGIPTSIFFNFFRLTVKWLFDRDLLEQMVFLGCQGDQEELDPQVLLANG